MGLLGMIGKALLSDALYVREENPQRRILRESIKNNRGSSTLEKFNASLVNLSDATDITKRIGHALSDLSVDEAKKEFAKGDHIATLRSAYSHHGIYDGNGYVYEYQDGIVQRNSIESFSSGDRMYKVDESADYSANEIIRRAKSRLGEQSYNVAYNNCENFATWCRRGN